MTALQSREHPLHHDRASFLLFRWRWRDSGHDIKYRFILHHFAFYLPYTSFWLVLRSLNEDGWIHPSADTSLYSGWSRVLHACYAMFNSMLNLIPLLRYLAAFHLFMCTLQCSLLGQRMICEGFAIVSAYWKQSWRQRNTIFRWMRQAD